MFRAATRTVHSLLFSMQRWNRSPRVLLLVVLLIGLLAGVSAPAFVMRDVKAAQVVPVTVGDVVISEFKTSGVNGQSDEFIELYNRTSSPIDIGGWKLRRSGSCSTGSPSTVTDVGTIPSGTILGPGKHFLIGGISYSDLIEPDQTVIMSIADDGGMAIYYSDNTTIIDKVGLCASSPFKNGTSLPSLGVDSNKSYERKVGDIQDSCVNTNDNFADFNALISPKPQNLFSVPVTLCGGPVPTATFTPTFTPTNTSTSTPTFTPTSTVTLTPTNTSTNTATATLIVSSTYNPRVLINEVAWAGTSSVRSGDEWIELYNTTTADISLDGWKLVFDRGVTPQDEVVFDANDIIAAGEFFLLAHPFSDDCSGTDYLNVFTNVAENKCYNINLSNNPSGQELTLKDNLGRKVDYANSGRGSWPAGSITGTSSYSTMERKGKIEDGTFDAWHTFGGATSTLIAKNRDGALVRGTPGLANWISTAVPTATPGPTFPFVPTKAKPPTRTPVPTPRPVGRPFINEFLPRPGFDWNQDGKADVFDEFIELKNVGNADMDLSGWSLDDEADFPGAPSSSPYTIPSLILKPGEYALFYASETNILLSDGGDSVRLFDASGRILDVIDYSIAKVEDESVCRFPDGNGFGSWFDDCTPTPNLTNSRDGSAPNGNSQSPVCSLPDTLPADFLFAECRGYGANIWNEFYWDEFGWQGDQNVPDNLSKWKSFVE